MPSTRSWSLRFLLGLARFAYRQPFVVLLVALAFFVGSLLLAYNGLVFATDRAALVDENEKFAQLGRAFQKEFPGNDDIVVLIEAGTTAERERFVDGLAARLEKRPELFRDIFTKVELPFLRSHALSYLDVGDLKKMVASLKEARTMMQALSSENGVGELLSETSGDLEKMLPILNEILGQLLKSLETRGRFEYSSPWEKAFFDSSDTATSPGQQGSLLKEANKTAFYNTLADGMQHMLLVRATDDTEEAVRQLRLEIRRLKPAYPDLEVGITGEVVLDLDEMDSSIGDSYRATMWSLALVAVLFVLSFGQLWRPLMALVSLILAMGWTLGFTTLAIGHLNLLTVTFATMLIGLGVDFGIHTIYSYEEGRFKGLEPLAAMEETMAHAGVESLTGAITTMVAFLAIRFTKFRGVAELGLIAGVGVVLCFLAMATVLPALIFLQERRGARVTEPRPFWANILAALERIYLGYPWIVVAIGAVITVSCATRIDTIKFDYNLLNLQSKTLPSVQTELKLIARDSHGVLFAVALADNLEQAEKLSEQLSKLPSVSKVESVLPLVPKDYESKLPYLEEIEGILKDIPLPDAAGPANSGSSTGLIKMGDGFMVLEKSFRMAYPALMRNPDPEVREQARRFDKLLTHLFSTLEKMGPGPIADGVTSFQESLFSDLHSMLEFMKSQRARPAVTLDALPPPIRLRSLGKTGKILLRIYPAGNPWEREPLSRFVSSLQKVVPSVIGTPVMVYYHTQALKEAYEVSGWYAFIAICIILLVHFRNLRDTLLALLPKVTGVIWMLGMMSVYHVDFNPANFMALPLILGIGLIFGVHVVHRLLDSPHEGIFSHSTGPAIALSATTTMAGFGTLMMGKHQGVASLGFLMTAGVGANVITSLVLLPAVMRILFRNKK